MIYGAIIVFLVGIDQLTKYWARNYLSEVDSIEIIKNFLHLTYVENRGAAFGMFQGGSFIFGIISIIVLLGLFIYLNKSKSPKVQYFIGSIITAGALGNLIDRFKFGYVTDMIDFRGIWQWVFNVADIYVVLGGVAFLWVIMIEERQKQSVEAKK
ncbi:MAG: signal peptidase II [Filifactoraceae bacterium]